MTTHLHIYSSENGKIDNGECVNDMVEGFLNILWRCEKEEKEKVGGGGVGGWIKPGSACGLVHLSVTYNLTTFMLHN